MPIGFPSTANAVNVPTTTATTVLSGIVAGFDDIDQPNSASANVIGAQGARALIKGEMNVTIGTAATSVAISCFANGGRQIGSTRNVSVTAGATQEIPFMFTDTVPNDVISYSIQVQFTAATGNSTVNAIIATADQPG